MTWEQIDGKWQQAKGKVRENWGRLTNDDLEVIAGNRDVLVGKLKEKYSLAKEEAEREIDDFARSIRI